MSTNQRVTVPRDLFESMSRVWSLYQMGMLIPAPADSPIKMPGRDSGLPEARHTPAPQEPPIVGTAAAPPELDASVPRIPAIGLGSEWRGTNAAAPPKKDAAAA